MTHELQATAKVYLDFDPAARQWRLSSTMFTPEPVDADTYCADDCAAHQHAPAPIAPPTIHELANLIIWTPDLWNADGTPRD